MYSRVAEKWPVSADFRGPKSMHSPRGIVMGETAGVLRASFFPLRTAGDGPSLAVHNVVPVLERSWRWFGLFFRWVFGNATH